MNEKKGILTLANYLLSISLGSLQLTTIWNDFSEFTVTLLQCKRGGSLLKSGDSSSFIFLLSLGGLIKTHPVFSSK